MNLHFHKILPFIVRFCYLVPCLSPAQVSGSDKPAGVCVVCTSLLLLIVCVYVRSLRLVNSAINSDSIILCDVFHQSSKLAYYLAGYNCGFGWKHLKFYTEQDSSFVGFMQDVMAYRHSIALLSLMTLILPAVLNSYFSYLFVYCIYFLCCLLLFSSLFS